MTSGCTPDWPKDQLTRWYEAPVAGLSFNDNCVLVKVNAGPRSGAAAQVETLPPVPLFDVASSARTVGRSRDQWLSIDRRGGDEAHVLTVRGGVYLRSEGYDKWVAVADPMAYFASALRQGFDEEGLVIDGEDRMARDLDGAAWQPVWIHRSGLLPTLDVINKRSQNFYAESLLKLLGHEQCGAGTWERGLDVVREFLHQAGIEDGYRMADGSGMSRNNRFTPEQLTQLLRYMFFHPWGDEFVRSLPYSGEADLKWERRLATPPYRGNVLGQDRLSERRFDLVRLRQGTFRQALRLLHLAQQHPGAAAGQESSRSDRACAHRPRLTCADRMVRDGNSSLRFSPCADGIPGPSVFLVLNLWRELHRVQKQPASRDAAGD